ncbi:NUDIX domain-containing protein [Acidaminobacter sp. JC074]|uniref:NUDIX hydrolase n=1 Tax=Acidaminobacter sp. JC074 TaxID=2530199 RepID=UPI001F0DB5EC|nr:NUDIX domain-containing protein [Acidaminobacter sp. JC074]MCH4888273.1 NUDIX domain-containing protein [Acidaminobacter sp. JC074]
MRAPYQVLVIPFLKKDNDYSFAIFSRADMDCFQWIAGGGEDFDASILDAAKRECLEEAGISDKHDFLRLDTVTSIPVSIFGEFPWGDHVYVIPEYAFGVELKDENLFLSKEHKSYKWVSYQEAIDLLKYDSNRTALWELMTRVSKNKEHNDE